MKDRRVARETEESVEFLREEDGLDLLGNAMLTFVIAVALAVAIRSIEPIMATLRNLIETVVF